MAIIHWQPISEIETFRRQMDRLFDEVSGLSTQSTIAFKPAIEIHDTENTLVLKAQLPGIDPEALDITVTQEEVIIQGERKYEQASKEGGVHRSEFRYGQFKRVLALPVEVQQEAVTADYTHGVLTLTLPKVVNQAKKPVKVSLSKPAIANTESSHN